MESMRHLSAAMLWAPMQCKFNRRQTLRATCTNIYLHQMKSFDTTFELRADWLKLFFNFSPNQNQSKLVNFPKIRQCRPIKYLERTKYALYSQNLLCGCPTGRSALRSEMEAREADGWHTWTNRARSLGRATICLWFKFWRLTWSTWWKPSKRQPDLLFSFELILLYLFCGLQGSGAIYISPYRLQIFKRIRNRRHANTFEFHAKILISC